MALVGREVDGAETVGRIPGTRLTALSTSLNAAVDDRHPAPR